jgi:membrane-associated protease RseP (regulator of RpoE activity)
MRSLTLLILTTTAVTVATAQQPDRPRCRDCATTAEGRASAEARAALIQDSLRLRAGNFEGDIERVAAQLLMLTQTQSQARQNLTALLSGQVAEANRGQAEVVVRRLRQQLDQATRESQALRTQLASLCDRNAKPQGYMGITFSATMRADAAASGTEVFRFAENPTVETVEPGSPAERAGVEKGDEILLIDNRAMVGRDIVFSRLLRPGSRLPLRVRRDGDTRDVVLLIKQRPPSLDNGCPFLDARIMAAFGDPVSIGQWPLSGAIVRTGPLPPVPATMAPGARVRVLQPLEAPIAVGTTPSPSGTVTIATPAPLVPSVPLPSPSATEPPPPAQRTMFVFSGTSSAPMLIAGATIVRTNSDLRETFGVKSGVLVLDVARGSPAYSSGLKGGDVIVSVGRVAVTSPLSIQRAMEATEGRELALRIIRKKKEQSLTLSW